MSEMALHCRARAALSMIGCTRVIVKYCSLLLLRHFTANPKPKPETLNPKPEIKNLKP